MAKCKALTESGFYAFCAALVSGVLIQIADRQCCWKLQAISGDHWFGTGLSC